MIRRTVSPLQERPASTLSSHSTQLNVTRELPPPMLNANSQAKPLYAPHAFILSSSNAFETSSISNAFDFTVYRLPEDRFPCRTMGPYLRNPYFVGRTEILNAIKAQLLPYPTKLSTASVAICGLGGMGKTQVALSFALAEELEFETISWAVAEDQIKLANSFANFSLALGLIKHIRTT
jgi:hypothetical protein